MTKPKQLELYPGLAHDLEEILIPADTIQKKVAELGKKISQDYAGKELCLVCVLKGAVIFLSDLIRSLVPPVCYDFMAISSYGQDTKSSGVVKILKDLDESIESKHVLVVEDIVDSGLTLHYILNNLRARNVASLKVCALLDKPDHRKVSVKVDYNGFIIPDKFVVGYGLDYNQKYRNVPFIFTLKPEVYS